VIDLNNLMAEWQGKRVLVVGDVMLDTLVDYETVRPCNEFKGPILREVRRRTYAGGAGNVAMNCVSLGAKVTLLGAVGNDPAGQILEDILYTSGIECPWRNWAVRKRWFKTTVKTRVSVDGRPSHRIDEDTYFDLGIQEFGSTVRENQFDVLLLSDYQKGVFTKTDLVLKHVVGACRRQNPNVVVAINPKPHTVRYLPPSLDLVSLNDSEFQAVRELQSEGQDKHLGLPCHYLMHTMGAKGLQITGPDDRVFGLRPTEVIDPDVCGCGDATFAAASLALSVTRDTPTIVTVAALAGAAKAALKGTEPVYPINIFNLYQPLRAMEYTHDGTPSG
jgi:rfaE bifunctional protein kinase chain/domain